MRPPWSDLDTPFGFLTNCSARLAELAAARSALRPLFVLSAEEAGWYKPDRRAYHAACKRLGIEPPDAMLVAGSGYDAVGAHAAGLPSVLIQRRYDMDLADDRPLFESLTHLMAALQPGHQAGQRR